jgi:hypothetical protein
MKRHGIFLQPPTSGKEIKKTMPMGIVTDTCPAPECNLTQQDIEQFVDEIILVRCKLDKTRKSGNITA